MDFFVKYLEHITYIGVFLMLGFSGYFLPVPEEVILLFVGYGSATGQISLLPAVFISFASIFLGDYLLYRLSLRGSDLVDRFLPPGEDARFDRYRAFIQKHPAIAVFVLRFAVGLRFLSVVQAGILRVRARTFVVSDILALIIYVPTVITLGYHFHSQLTRFITEATLLRHGVTILTFVAIGVFLYYSIKKKYHIKI